MTIERDGQEQIVECDRVGCRETFLITGDFQSGWKEAAREGWRTRRIGEDWIHGCPKHAREVCLRG
jgi:hypothetical protein